MITDESQDATPRGLGGARGAREGGLPSETFGQVSR